MLVSLGIGIRFFLGGLGLETVAACPGCDGNAVGVDSGI